MRSWMLGLAVFAGLAAPATSPADLPDLDVRTDRDAAYAGRNDGLLTGRRTPTPERIALDYARDAFGLNATTSRASSSSRRVRQPGRHHPPALQPGPRRHRVLRLRPRRARHARRPPDQQLLDGACAAPGSPTPAVVSALAGPRRGARLDATGSRSRRASIKSAPGHDLRHRRGGQAALDRHRRRRCASRGTSTPRATATSYSRARRRRVGRHARPHGPDASSSAAPATSRATRTPRRSTQITMPPSWYDQHNGGTRLWGQYSRTYIDPNDQDPAPGSEQGGTPRPDPGQQRRRAARTGSTRAARRSRPRRRARPAAARGTPRSPASRATNQFQAATNVHVLVGRFSSTSRRRRSASTRRRATSSASTRAAPGSATTTSGPRSTTARASTTRTSRRRPTAARRACRCSCSQRATSTAATSPTSSTTRSATASRTG